MQRLRRLHDQLLGERAAVAPAGVRGLGQLTGEDNTRVRAHDAPAQLEVQSRVLAVAAGVYVEVVRQRLLCVCDDAAS